MIAEGEIIAHYNEQVEIIGQRLAVLCNTKPKGFENELETVSKEVSGIKEEVKNLIPLADGESGRKGFEAIAQRIEGFLRIIQRVNPTKTASQTYSMPAMMPKAVLRAFSEAAMLA